MAIRIGLALVEGTLRCNKWSLHSEGSSSDTNKLFSTSIRSLLERTDERICKETTIRQKLSSKCITHKKS